MRARDQAACEIFDGVPPRAEEGEVTVEIQSPGPVSGTLVVRYVMTTGRFTVPSGKLIGDLSKTGRVSHASITLLRCLDRKADLELELDDGLVARGSHEENKPSVLLTASRPAIVKGRLLSEGEALSGTPLFVFGEHGAAAGAMSDAEGRFEVKLLPEKEGTWGMLEEMSPQWRFAERSPSFQYGPGTRLDLGDLQLKRKPPIKPGFIGIGFKEHAAEPLIDQVTTGTPAQRAGLAVGDVIVEVDGVAVGSQAEAIARIPGDPGTHVRLKIRRGTEFLLFDLTRQTE